MRGRILIGTLLAGAALAAPASAATVTREGDGTLVYTASPGVANHATVQAQDGTGATVVYTSGEAITAVPAGCSLDLGDEEAICPPAPAARLELGDGDDQGGVSYTVRIPVTVVGGAGDDALVDNGAAATLLGGDGKDTLAGGDGADVLAGGPGDDELDGGAGPDRLLGEEGDDLLAPDGRESPSPDVVDGGPGVDRIESDWTDRHDQSAPPVTVTLAGGADDGRPGEGDDVRGVEAITTHQASTLVGTDAPERLDAYFTVDGSTLTGAGGADELDGGGGPDHLDGGTGDDLLDGGFGDDVITGGPGRDRVFADKRGGDCGPVWCNDPYGNDTVDVRDGEVDQVDCGAGVDTVLADPVDVVAADCERVERSGGGAAPPTGPEGPAVPVAGATGLRVNGHPSLRRALRHGLRVRVAGRAATTVVARVHGRRVGAGRGHGTVLVRFSRAGRRRLAHRGRVTVVLLAAGARVTVTLRG